MGTGADRASDCCPSGVDPRIARHFDESVRARLSAGVLPPLHPVSRALLDLLLVDVADARPTVLELGCGTGALTVALLEHGATHARGLDLSPESVAAARRRADERGLAARATFEIGDGASHVLERHDWVVLDRVICCYADVRRLLGNSIPAAGTRYAFSVPISWGWRGRVTRLLLLIEDATRAARGRLARLLPTRLRGDLCPGYAHDVRRIEQRLVEAGFRRRRHTTHRLWYAAVFDRSAPSG